MGGLVPHMLYNRNRYGKDWTKCALQLPALSMMGRQWGRGAMEEPSLADRLGENRGSRSHCGGLGAASCHAPGPQAQANVLLLQLPARAALRPPGALTALPTGLCGSPCPSASSGASSWQSCYW